MLQECMYGCVYSICPSFILSSSLYMNRTYFIYSLLYFNFIMNWNRSEFYCWPLTCNCILNTLILCDCICVIFIWFDLSFYFWFKFLFYFNIIIVLVLVIFLFAFGYKGNVNLYEKKNYIYKKKKKFLS